MSLQVNFCRVHTDTAITAGTIDATAKTVAIGGITYPDGVVFIASNGGSSYFFNGTSIKKIGEVNALLSVNGKTGTVTLTKADIGLGNVDNVSMDYILTDSALTGTPTCGAPTTDAGVANKKYVDDAIQGINSTLIGALHYKGSVQSLGDLPTVATTENGIKHGDVYNVKDDGMDYVALVGPEYIGTTGNDGGKKRIISGDPNHITWDALGSTVDLSGYYDKTETDTLLADKQDKLSAAQKEAIDKADTLYFSELYLDTTDFQVKGTTAEAGKVHTMGNATQGVALYIMCGNQSNVFIPCSIEERAGSTRIFSFVYMDYLYLVTLEPSNSITTVRHKIATSDELALKQDKLTAAQQAAVDSGATRAIINHVKTIEAGATCTPKDAFSGDLTTKDVSANPVMLDAGMVYDMDSGLVLGHQVLNDSVHHPTLRLKPATDTQNGYMASADKNKLDAIGYGVCGVPVAQVDKPVDVGSSFRLQTGARVTVKFTTNNTAAAPTLNVSGTGSKPIVLGDQPIGDKLVKGMYDLVYDGTAWNIVGGLGCAMYWMSE